MADNVIEENVISKIQVKQKEYYFGIKYDSERNIINETYFRRDEMPQIEEVIRNAQTATSEAEKVDATITDANVLEVTGRDGVKKSLELASQADAATIKTELAKKFDKASVVHESGNAEDKVMSQKAVSDKLRDLVTSLESEFSYKGIAQPTTNPGVPDNNVFYIAGEGSYPNFGNQVVEVGQIAVLKWDGSWHKEVLEIGAGGGNMILEWDTDVVTTRKQVLQKYRKQLLQISYKNANGDIVNEQYIGTLFTDTEWVKDANWSKINAYKDVDEKYNIPHRCSPYKYLKDKFVRMDKFENGTGNTAIVFKVEANKTYLIRGFLTPLQDDTLGARTGLYTYFADEDLTQHIFNIGGEINLGNYSFVRRCIFKATQDGYLVLNNVYGIRTDYVWLYSLPKNENTTALDIQDIEIVNSNKYHKLLPIAQKDNSNLYEMKIDRWYLIRINSNLLSGVYGKYFASWYVDKELTNRISAIVFNTHTVSNYYADILINPYNGGKLNFYAYLKFIDDIDKQGIAEIYEVSDYSDYYRAISINCEGDSLTAGLNGGGHTYPKKLKELINLNYEGSNITINNWGLTGATAQTIAMNAEAMSYSLFEDLVIPAGESKAGKFYDYINKQMLGTPVGQNQYVSIFDKKYQPMKIATPITTIINDTDEEVTYKKGEKIFFRRKRIGSSTLVKPKILCIYLGRNDRFEGIATDVAINHMINCIKQMLEHYNPENYVVISQFDFWYSFDNEEKMIQYEDAFEREFNAHFINFRWYARNKWFEYSGLVPTENDKAAMAKGGAPKSIYATNDVIHLGAAGYDFLGTIVFERLIDLGVLPALPSYNMGS